MISIGEGVGKMKAALEGRQDPSTVIIGRTSALAIAGIPETIERVKAYERAGVDAIFLAGASTHEQVEAVNAEISLPLILGGTSDELSDKEYLGANGVRVALQGHMPFQATVQAVYTTLKALRDGVSPKDLQGLPSADLMAQVTRKADYDRWAKVFLA